MARDQDQFKEDDSLLRGGLMSFGSHLDELRSRLMKAAIVPVALMLLIFLKAAVLREFLAKPLLAALAATGNPPKLQVLGPTESLMVDVQISLWAAIVLSTPWILWQVWKFVEPGLHERERKASRFVSLFISACFFSGIAFGYFVFLPISLRFCWITTQA